MDLRRVNLASFSQWDGTGEPKLVKLNRLICLRLPAKLNLSDLILWSNHGCRLVTCSLYLSTLWLFGTVICYWKCLSNGSDEGEPCLFSQWDGIGELELVKLRHISLMLLLLWVLWSFNRFKNGRDGHICWTTQHNLGWWCLGWCCWLWISTINKVQRVWSTVRLRMQLHD